MNRIIFVLLTSTTVLFASNASPVPEPGTYLMMGAGLGALLLFRSKFGKKK